MGVRAPLTIAISGKEFGIGGPFNDEGKPTSLSAAGSGGKLEDLSIRSKFRPEGAFVHFFYRRKQGSGLASKVEPV
jgi:hypothetical protein